MTGPLPIIYAKRLSFLQHALTVLVALLFAALVLGAIWVTAQ